MLNKHIETMSRADMRALQLERLKATVANCYDNVPFYRAKLEAIGFNPSMIKSLSDLQNIPFTVKDDLRENYPFGLLARSMREIVRIHGSSGTTGKPTIVAYTKDDLAMWTECVARLCVMAGATPDDIAQVAFGYGLFTGALGLHQGLEHIGASVIPMSSGQTEKQLMLMRDFGTTILIATPSYAIVLGEAIEGSGISKSDLKLRIALLGADSLSDDMRNTIEDKLGVFATENYGLSEIIGPGVSGECIHRCGLHINEDNFYPEIIDPDTGEVKPLGETGELVITTITKQGLPLLRYRTKDITYLTEEPCQCGRTLMRMGKVAGRTDDMLIVHGVNLFPSQIGVAIADIPEISPHYHIEVDRRTFKDVVKVIVELQDASVLESYAKLEGLEKQVKYKLKIVTGLNLKVQIVPPKTIAREMGKAKRVTILTN